MSEEKKPLEQKLIKAGYDGDTHDIMAIVDWLWKNKEIHATTEFDDIYSKKFSGNTFCYSDGKQVSFAMTGKFDTPKEGLIAAINYAIKYCIRV